MPDVKQPRGEFGLIARYFSELDAGPDVVLGNGDDASVLRLSANEELAVSVDSMLEGVHFPQNSPPADIAYRAVAGAVSDLAAMGARPMAMTLALSLPKADDNWLASFRAGLVDAVSDFSMPLVGGDLTRGPLAITVQVMGAVNVGQAIRRSGAKAGDVIYVGGPLGDSAAGLAVLEGRLTGEASCIQSLLQSFWRPKPALQLGLSLRGLATAAVDISDGLLADLEHIATASGVAATVQASKVPLSEALCAVASTEQALAWALAGGEDYQLCFTLPGDINPPKDCISIGCVESGSGVRCDQLKSKEGYRHF